MSPLTCGEYNTYFTYKLNFQCMESDNPEALSVILGSISIILAAVCYILYRRANVIINRIVTPTLLFDYDETYCSLSLAIAVNTKFMIFISGFLLLYAALEYLVLSSY